MSNLLLAFGIAAIVPGSSFSVRWLCSTPQEHHWMLAASPQGGGLQRRVDLNNGGTLEAGGHVDDLSISGEYISLLRLERMNRGSFWGRIYMKDGQDIVLSISAPKGKIDVTAEADQGLPVSPQGEGSSADEAVIDRMVQRFLSWRLPENFNPDNGISFKPTFNDHMDPPMRCNPTGTNLFDALQAKAMVRYILGDD